MKITAKGVLDDVSWRQRLDGEMAAVGGSNEGNRQRRFRIWI
jgi:hypothetical protein